MDEADAARIVEEAEANGKADYGWECALEDASGEVVAISQNLYQMRSYEPSTPG